MAGRDGRETNATQRRTNDHLIVVDSVELEMAELAVKRTQNTAVRDYANMLMNDHRGHLVAPEDRLQG